MKKLLAIIVLGLLWSGNAYARGIGIDKCIVDIAGFFIIETLIVLIIVAALLFFLGMPLRKIIKSNIETNLRKNKNYKPNKLLLWMYESSGLIILFIISIIFTLMFI